jgi:putative thioredoxin
VDVSESNFQTAVIERSRDIPVVVDFWATWCGPCRTLGPILEREAEKRTGNVELVKLDTDANPGLARTYGIQSIPAVKAFKDGEVVSEFVGAQPAPVVARFLDSLFPSPGDLLVKKGDEASLRAALEADPDRSDAAVALARIVLARGEVDEAERVLERVRGSFAADGMAARIRLQKAGTRGLEAALKALDRGDTEEALDRLIELIPTSGKGRDDLRRVVVGVLDELGVDDHLAAASRRRLASALY